jgi:hypothetical protein
VALALVAVGLGTQFRMAWALGSDFRASASGLIPERTISIIRRRYSGGYGARHFGMVDSLPTRA